MTKAGADDLEWDDKGRLVTGASSLSLDYNWADRLRSGALGDYTINTKCDPMGNRVWKESIFYDGQSYDTTTRKYILDIAGDLPVVLCAIDTEGSLKNSFFYGDAQIFCQYGHTIDPFTSEPYVVKHYYIHDRLGSVRLIITASGTPCSTYTYDPFGQEFPAECIETIDNPFQYAGQWYDEEIAQYSSGLTAEGRP